MQNSSPRLNFIIWQLIWRSPWALLGRLMQVSVSDIVKVVNRRGYCGVELCAGLASASCFHVIEFGVPCLLFLYSNGIHLHCSALVASAILKFVT